MPEAGTDYPTSLVSGSTAIADSKAPGSSPVEDQVETAELTPEQKELSVVRQTAEEQNVNLQNQPISGNPAGVKTVDDTWLDRQIENQNAQDNATRDLREANREYTTAVQAYNTYGTAAFRQDPTLRGRLEKAVADRQRLTAELNRLEQERTAIDANKPAGNF